MSEGEVSRHSSQSNPRDAWITPTVLYTNVDGYCDKLMTAQWWIHRGRSPPPRRKTASKIFLNANENKSRYRKLSSFVCVGRLLCRIAVSKVLRTCWPPNQNSVAEWSACWTQAQKAQVQIAVATLSGKWQVLGKLLTPIVPLFTKQQNW